MFLRRQMDVLIYLSMIESTDEQDLFERLYLKYRYLMFHVANQILCNHHDAEDAVHQAFVAVIQNMDKFSQVECPKTRSLVVLIVERKAIDILRKRNREKHQSLDDEIIGVQIPVPGDHGLADALSRLSPHYREVLLMRYDNGLTSREIAKLLDISESGVRKLLGRAKQKLREELEKEGVVL